MSSAHAISMLNPAVRRNADIGLAIFVVGVVGLLIMPLPGAVLDILIACSIGIALVVLLAAFYATGPLEFSAFPTVLLLLTLFRLSLNLRSTYLILTTGEAGHVIDAFGNFVIGGNYAVGIILFLILIGINFIVITKGAGRVAEVAARFTLDSMPGKQMAIDAELSGGFIDADEARRRREKIASEADFFGAMDGSSKFVKGDAIAGLVITAINLMGGFFIGVIQLGMPLPDALATYTVLTVGDGLVSQIPALVVSTAAGLMVTKTAGSEGTGAAVVSQLVAHPRALWVAAGFLALLGAVPGFPILPFWMLAGITAVVASRLNAAEDRHAAASEAALLDRPRPAPDPAGAIGEILQINTIELDIGYALIPLADERQGGDLPDRIRLIRKQVAASTWLLLPEVTIMDDVRLPATDYVLRLRGAEVARGELMPRFLLALDTGGVVQDIEGMETRDPAHGIPGRWISRGRRVEAESYGYVVVEPTTVIATHLSEVLKQYGSDLLGRQDVQDMVDALKRTHPALVADVVPGKIALGVLHRVLQRLLREHVPIRDLVTILEALGDAADQKVTDPEALTEYARRSLPHVIGRMYVDSTGVIRGITIGETLAGQLMRMWGSRSVATDSSLLRDPEALGETLRALHALSELHQLDGRPLPLVVPGSLRVGVRRLIEPVLPQVPVLSFDELPPHLNIDFAATWEIAGHEA
jgi:flagellar biosynthesis protein FlhA